MKLITPIICALTLFIAGSTSAQVPNGSFENWNTNTNESPDGWDRFGQATKVDLGSGNYAVKIAPDLFTEQQGGLFSKGASVSGMGFGGGFPYSSRPDTVELRARWNMGANDTGQFLMAFTRFFNGSTAPIGFATFEFTGTQSSYVTLKIPASFFVPFVNPDTAFIFMSSGDMDLTPTDPNTFLEVDFVRTTLAGNNVGTIPNGSLNNWTTTTSYSPVGWLTSDDFLSLFGTNPNSVSRIAGQTGTYAIRMQNSETSLAGLFPGAAFVSNGSIPDDPENTPGFAVTERYASLRGYYQYDTENEDSGFVLVRMYKNGQVVGEGGAIFDLDQSTWAPFATAIVYDPMFTGVPDSGSILITSADVENVKSNASWLAIDELRLETFPVSVKNFKFEHQLSAYPNPAVGSTTVTYSGPAAEQTQMVMLDVSGKEIARLQATFENGKAIGKFNTSGLASGTYLVKCTNSAGNSASTLVLVP